MDSCQLFWAYRGNHRSTPHKGSITTGLLLALLVCAVVPDRSLQASIYEYGVYKVKAAINGDDQHPGMTKIDSKSPGTWATGASAYVEDNYGAVYNAWSIDFMNSREAQVNIDMGYLVGGSSYANSYAGEDGEIHIRYHSDTPFTLNYYWDLTWDLFPSGYLDFNSFAQSVRLRIYDSMDNWQDHWGPTSGSKYYGLHGQYIGSEPINLGAGDWLFIVFDGGSPPRYGGEMESLKGSVYLDFDGGDRVLVDADFNDDGRVDIGDVAFMAQTWMLSAGQDGYQEVCDLVDDDVIDINDLVIFAEYWLD